MSKLDLRFTYGIKTQWDTTMFTANVVYLTTPDRGRKNDAGVRNPMASDGETAAYASLGVTAYFNPEFGWYGWGVSYVEPTHVELRQAEHMVKMLRKIRRALDRFNETLGSETDLAGFCGRVAQAIGVTNAMSFGEYAKEMQMSETHYRWTDVDGLRSKLAKVVEDAKRTA